MPGSGCGGRRSRRREKRRRRPLVTGTLRRRIGTVPSGVPAHWNRKKLVTPLMRNRGRPGWARLERRSLCRLALPETEGLGQKDGTCLGADCRPTATASTLCPGSRRGAVTLGRPEGPGPADTDPGPSPPDRRLACWSLRTGWPPGEGPC
ncbi:hypothetical protein NDU88_003477 [Pleurodeles waltl]|uniref:Uncharacterized protein n=1 Tax=Pleurodeles waltl TaxID=8319 RepID=A0AAV7UYK1_PLEWA|nr:hypothetical protein NDU88_003477 [Pleurodeles waltl]